MNKILLLLGVAGLLLTAGCRKDDEVVCAPATSIVSLADFSRGNMPAEQVFNLPDVSQTQTIRTAGGAVLTIPGNSLMVASTGAAATGAAQLRFREIYEVPDMILADLPTQTSGFRTLPYPTAQSLESAGEFQIQLWQGRQRLISKNGPVPTPLTLTSIRPSRTINIRPQPRWWTQALLPAPTVRDTADTAGWQLSTSGFVRIDSTMVGPGTPAFYAATFPLDSLSWHNVDWLWSYSPYLPAAAVKVIVPGYPAQALSTLTTRVYLIPARGNIALRLGYRPADDNWQLGNLPATSDYTVVVVQSDGAGGLRFAKQRFTLDRMGNTFTIDPVKMSQADVLRLIRQL